MGGEVGGSEPVPGIASSRASLGPVIPAFLGLAACSLGLSIPGSKGDWPRRAGSGELMGNEDYRSPCVESYPSVTMGWGRSRFQVQVSKKPY